MGALGRILRLGWFAGLAGASVVAQACGGATSGRRLPPGAGGADGATGGGSGTGGATSGAGGDTVGSGGATGGVTSPDAGLSGSGGFVIVPPDAGIQDADLWDVIYE